MKIHEFDDYRGFIKFHLTHGKSRAPRGRLSELAKKIGCHVTYLNQVIRGKSDLSIDQGFRFCNYLLLSDSETDFFLDMLNFERSGEHSLKDYYSKKINKEREARYSLEKKILSPRLKKDYELEYFSNWRMQIVHCLLQVEGLKTSEKIVKSSGLKENIVIDQLEKLVQFGLATKGPKGNWQSTENSLHLDRNSPAFRLFHSLWRNFSITKVLGEDSRPSKNSGKLNYSSLITTSDKTAKAIFELLSKDIQEVSSLTEKSRPKAVFFLGIDFFKLDGLDLPKLSS